eukprot:TCONS_00043592-protein
MVFPKEVSSTLFYLISTFMTCQKILMRSVCNMQTSLYRHTRPQHFVECTEKIDNDIKDLQRWSKTQNLLFNSKKTKTVLFSTQQMARRHQFEYEIKSLDEKNIERVKTFKLLGITFSEDMKWNAHIKKGALFYCPWRN